MDVVLTEMLAEGAALYINKKELALINPIPVIVEAKGGDLPACMAISDMLQTDRLPSSVIPDAFEMCVTHIKNCCPPEKADTSAFELAEVSFKGLTVALLSFVSGMDDPSLLLRPILQAWPSVLVWARARFIQNVHVDDCSSQIWLPMFLRGILELRKSPELQFAANDPCMLELAMHLHLHHDEANISCITACTDFLTRYIETSILRSDAPPQVCHRKALDAILSAAHDDPEVLLKPILGLSSRIGDSRPLLIALLSACMLLGNFVLGQSNPVALALKEKGLPSMSKILGLLTGLAPATHRTRLFTETFVSYIGLFALMSMPQDGATWLIEALQYPIFHAIAASRSLLSKPDTHQLRTLLSSCLAAHLIHPSVIFACENALSTLSAEKHAQIMSSAIAPAWRAFIDRFFEQYVFYCYFEIACHSKGCYKCGSAAKGENKLLRKCTACKNVEYCSSDCQASDWKGHKKECKRLRDRKNDPLPNWAMPLFKRSLAEYDARRHLPGIRTLAAHKFSCFPLQSLCVGIIYGTFPPRLTLFPMSEVPVPYDNLEEQPLDPSVRFDDVRLQNGSIGILATKGHVDGEVETTYEKFRWSGPYFSSKHGTLCPNMSKCTSLVTPYVYLEGKGERKHATTWSVVDELAYRGGLSPQTILEGKMGEIRRKVLEVIVREKARMRVVNDITTSC